MSKSAVGFASKSVAMLLFVAGCVSIQPRATGDRPPLSDIPSRGHDRAPEVRGARVLVQYEVSCSRCDVQFTSARGEQKDVGKTVGFWRHREQIAVAHRTASVTVRPKGEEDRVLSVRIFLDGSQVADAHVPAGGSLEPVALSVSLFVTPRASFDPSDRRP